MILGTRLIRAGLVDAAIVGGADALCRFTVNGFNSLFAPRIASPAGHSIEGARHGLVEGGHLPRD